MSIVTPSGKIITPDALFVKHSYARNNAEIDSPPLQMEGLFKFIVRRSDGSIKRETEFSRNLILNQGLNFFATSRYVGFCGVGTSTAVAAVSDTSLFSSPVYTTARTAVVETGSGAAPWWVASTATFRFDLGQLNGNYTEVGVGPASPALFSRALITPDGVNPAAISVQSDEQLDVIYQLRCYAPTADVTGNITLAGQNYGFTGRASRVNDFAPQGGFGAATACAAYSSEIAFGMRPFVGNNNNWVYTGGIGLVTEEPSGTYVPNGGSSTDAYSANSYQRTGRITYGLTEGNLAGGIRSMDMWVTGGGKYQYEFTPNIPKDNTKTLAIDMQVSWARRP